MSKFNALASDVLAVTAVSASKLLPRPSVPDLSNNNPPAFGNMYVVEILLATGTLAADDLVYVTFGTSSVVATPNNGTVLRPGVKSYHQLSPTDTHIAAISSANGANLAYAVGHQGS